MRVYKVYSFWKPSKLVVKRQSSQHLKTIGIIIPNSWPKFEVSIYKLLAETGPKYKNYSEFAAFLKNIVNCETHQTSLFFLDFQCKCKLNNLQNDRLLDVDGISKVK